MNIRNTRYMQYVSAFTGTLSVTTIALYAVWSSPILPKIATGETPLGNITKEESSWVVSSLSLGGIPGSILSGWLLEFFGRRGSLLISGVPLLFPWFAIAFSSSIWTVCILRFIAGAASSCAGSSIMLYNGEIAEKEIRGRIGTTFNIAGLIGELFILCTGPYLSYVTLTLASSVVPLIFLIVFYFMPESPYYLVKIGKENEARRNLRRLLRKDAGDIVIDDHMQLVQDTVSLEMLNDTSLWEFLTKREYRKSLVISLGVQTIQQLSGFIAIASYMQTILEHSKSSISPEIASIICGVVQFFAVLVATAIVDRVGRKPLLIISSLGCALALIMEGAYFFVQDVMYYDVESVSWIPAAGILMYIIMRPIGIGTLPFVLLGELFSTNIKGHAVAVSSTYSAVLSFVVAKSFEPVSNAWGVHVIFWIFAGICILGMFFVYYVLPETKGKTFAEIREALNPKEEKVIVPIISLSESKNVSCTKM